MTKKPTVSIGIPAYNEGQNIKHVLEAILKQDEENFTLEEIIVVSDGSTDDTEEQVRSITDPRLTLIVHETNQGISAAQNAIFDRISSDIAILVDADVIPVTNQFIEDLVSPFQRDNNLGLVSADRIAAPANSRFEALQTFGNALRTRIFRHINNADNIYMCFGSARAFHRRLYTKISWDVTAAEDAYSYIRNHELGFNFKFEPSAQVLFRSPSTFEDHARQSNRFRVGSMQLEKVFNRATVRQHYAIPATVFIAQLAKSFFRHPIMTTGYLGSTVLARLYKRLRPVDSQKFEMATSSKRVII